MSLLLATLLGTTACPGDDTSVMTTTGEDSTTTGDTTMSSVSVTVTVTVTDTTTDTPGTDSTTESVDSTDGTTTGETTDATTSGGPVCGDDMAQGDEQCDGTDLAEQDCISQGFTGGRLACAEDCTFDTSGCTSDPVCGNDMIDGKDVCDGADLGGADCTTEGFDGGTLGCLPDCTGYDTSACTSDTCEDEDIGMAVGPAVSMGDTLMADDDFDPSCGGTGGPDHVVLFTAMADGLYTFDTIGADYDTKLALFSDCDNASELDCNDDTFGVQSQLQLDMVAGQAVYIVIDGFDGATGNYVLNITEPSVCGDGAITGFEVCDGADVGGATCASAGLTGAGALTCNPDCATLDAAACNDPTGFGNCGTFPQDQACTLEEICADDGAGNFVCLELDCANVGECGPAPATGTAPVTCEDVTGDGAGDCFLLCDMGQTCPDGMTCALGFICLWPS